MLGRKPRTQQPGFSNDNSIAVQGAIHKAQALVQPITEAALPVTLISVYVQSSGQAYHGRPITARSWKQLSWAQIRLAAYSQGSRPSAEVPSLLPVICPLVELKVRTRTQFTSSSVYGTWSSSSYTRRLTSRTWRIHRSTTVIGPAEGQEAPRLTPTPGSERQVHMLLANYRGLEWRDHHVHVRSRTELPSRSVKSTNTRIKVHKDTGPEIIVQVKWNIKVVNEVVCGVHPLPPCTFLGCQCTDPCYTRFKVGPSIHRSLLHILNNPPSTDT